MKPDAFKKTETIRTRIPEPLYKKAFKRMLKFGTWSEYLRHLITRDIGSVKEL